MIPILTILSGNAAIVGGAVSSGNTVVAGGSAVSSGNTVVAGGSAVSSGNTVVAGSSAAGGGAAIEVGSGTAVGTDNGIAVNAASNNSTAAMSGVLPPAATGTNGHWCLDQNGWWYEYNNHTYPYNCWQCIGGLYYCFDESGYLRYGWIYWDNKWYYTGLDGALMANTRTPDGYYVGGDGVWIP